MLPSLPMNKPKATTASTPEQPMTCGWRRQRQIGKASDISEGRSVGAYVSERGMGGVGWSHTHTHTHTHGKRECRDSSDLCRVEREVGGGERDGDLDHRAIEDTCEPCRSKDTKLWNKVTRAVGSSEHADSRARAIYRKEQRAQGAASAGSSERREQAHEARTHSRSSSRKFEPQHRATPTPHAAPTPAW